MDIYVGGDIIRLKILHRILKRTKAYHIVGIFVLFVLFVSLVFWAIEPDITNYGDALWYSYVNLFTIGFGDIVPVTLISRILSVILTVYATVVIALITGVIVAFYQELCRRNLEETKEVLIDKLSNLDKLSKEELQEISKKVKEINK